jgi:PAS domain S-box-containing protein
VDGTNLEVMGSRFYSLERKVLLAFVVAGVALVLIGFFSLVGSVFAFSLLMAWLVAQNVWGAAKPRGITGRLAAIVESSDDAIISKTLDGIITSWNPAAERLFGYAAAEAIGRSMLIVIPPERAHEEVEILARIRSGRRIDHFKTRRARKDGTLIDVDVTISPVRDEHGRIIGASKIARDITERVQVEDETRQHIGLLSLAPALATDMDRRIVLWTRGAERLYGYTREEALGQVPDELLKTEFPEDLAEITKTLCNDNVWEGELEHRTRDGKRVVVASQWMLHRDPNGRPTRILEVNADITALKEAEAQQIRSQKLEALGVLAGGIAHDFNNILAAIHGSASLAISQFPPQHPVQACLTEIEKAGARATDMVRRILTFSRPQDQNKQPQELEPVVREALELVRATLPAMIEIRTAFATDLPKVCIDATQIFQIVVNLATNAAHAIGDRRGFIEVQLEQCIGEHDVQLYSEVPAGHYARLCVKDNGCGMDASTLQRIFDPFFSTKPTGKGTGLGLSVVHGIAKHHRAILKVQSEPERGTSFFVYFPAVRDTDVFAPPPERTVTCGRGERILFVDDERVLLFVGATNLAQNGYRVTSVSDGEAALRALRKNPHSYDAVLTDLSMPGMSGLQLAGEMRKLRPDIPVILTSGYLNPDDLNRAGRLGIRTILIKPVDTKELLNALADLFEKQGELLRN